MMKVRPGAIAREPGFSTSLALGVFGMIEAGLSVSPHYRAYAIAWAEDELARAGFGVVTAETARIPKASRSRVVRVAPPIGGGDL